MRVSETCRLPLARQQVWDLLNDPSVLARITPGVQKLEEEKADQFRVDLELGVGPVRGSFRGRIFVRDKEPPERLTLQVESQGTAGGVRATGQLLLQEEGGETIVHYTGEVQVTGTLASLGSRFIPSLTRMQAAEFFHRLQQEAERGMT